VNKKYRSDIDVLRALSVIAVMLYHANFKINNNLILPGGFLGVDIFFVISGYLITNIILQDLKNKKFSLKYFYERRIRRIIPAFLFLCLVTTPVAYLIMFPTNFLEFSESLFSSLFFISNIYFSNSNNLYGAEDNFLLPLLHTWSLSIEEQFYLLLPIFLILTFRFNKKKIIENILIILIISFVLSCIFLYFSDHIFGFYSIITRAWELLLGSLVAATQFNKGGGIKNIFLNNYGSVIGICLILFSFFFLDDEKKHPSYYTLLPTLGCCFVLIFKSQNQVVKKIFKLKFLISIGIISYSLYLWHYPIFTFSKITQFTNGIFLKKIFIVFLVFGISIFSYYFIEKPFRNKKNSFFKIMIILSLTYFLLVMMMIFIIKNEAFPKRTLITDNFNLDNRYYLHNDHYKFRENYVPELFTNNLENKNILVIGNSFGEDLFKMLYLNKDKYPNFNFELISPIKRDNSTSYQVKCLLNFLKINNTRCNGVDFGDSINKQIKKSDIIILSTKWDEADVKSLIEIIIELKRNDKKIIIFGQSLLMNLNTSYKLNPLDYYVYLNKQIPNEYDLNLIETKMYNQFNEPLNKELSKIAYDTNSKFIDPKSFQCSKLKNTCHLITKSKNKIYFDYGHVTNEGAKFLGGILSEKKILETNIDND
jgi:peptidoglycan/LPS O-acetylase OafA/YrhL